MNKETIKRNLRRRVVVVKYPETIRERILSGFIIVVTLIITVVMLWVVIGKAREAEETRRRLQEFQDADYLYPIR